MYVTLPFQLELEDAETATYQERVEGGKSPVIGTVSVKKSALPTPLPSLMRITLYYGEAKPAPSEHPGWAPSGRGAASAVKPLEPGDRVTVVKNRLRTVASPPEWLEQYVGKTGAVLWTTASGAMVDLPGSATWFSYQELERQNPDVP